jgi:hypothetical protein
MTQFREGDYGCARGASVRMKRKDGVVVIVAAAIFAVSIGAAGDRAGAAPVISPSTVATSPAHVGEPYEAALSFTAAATWTVVSGRLPPGLALQTGEISGVPTLAGSYTFVVQAADAGVSATKTYSILVFPPATSGYDARMDQAVVAREISPLPSNCNHTGYLTYAISALWRGEHVDDVNAKLATLKITQIGGTPKSCSSTVDESRNNLMLSLLIRPYLLYNATSSFFPGRLNTTAADNLVAQMWAYARPYSKLREAADSWSIFDSENHDAEAESFFFLAAQIFEGLPAYRNRVYADGSTVAQQFKAWRDHWSNYLDERAKRGLFVEAGAPTYAGYTVESLLNIYDFAADPVLRRKAGMVLDLEFADYAQHELRDVWGGAKSRSYPDDSYNGDDDTLTILGRQLFGPTTAVTGNNHALALATSGYSPPPVVQSLATGHAGLGSYADVMRRPGNGPKSFDPNDDWHVTPSKSVVDYAYCTPDYILGTAELKPGDSHIAPSSQNRWQGIIFNSTAGDRVYPQAAPSNVSPTNDAFLSIQNKFVLVTEKMAYTKQPTLVYFPITLDSVVEKHGWVFVREGSAYLAVRPAIGTYKWLTPAKNKASNRQLRFIQLSKATAPIIFEAGRAASYGSFGAFQSRIIANRLVHSGGALDYTTANGTHFTMYSDTTKAPKVNGQPPNYAPANVFNSPFMQSVWGSGKITIKLGAQSATYDFSQPANPTETVQ